MATKTIRVDYPTTELGMAQDTLETLVRYRATAGDDTSHPDFVPQSWVDQARTRVEQLEGAGHHNHAGADAIQIEQQRSGGSSNGNGGKGRGNGIFAIEGSPQVKYATQLLHRLWDTEPQTADELAAQLTTRTRSEVSRIIDNLMALLADQPRWASREQLEFLRALWSRKMSANDGTRNTEADAKFEEKLPTLSFDGASRMITQLKSLPDRTAAAAESAVTEGMYQAPNGTVFKVQMAHHGAQKLYAKQLVKLDEPRTSRGKEVGWEFAYAPGSIGRLQPEWKMTREQAQAWGQLYGACCRCGTVLTDELSQERGMGDTCYGKM